MNKSHSSDEGANERLAKIQTATLAEINHIQHHTPHHYCNMMRTALREQIEFYKSMVAILEPQLQLLESINA